MFRRCLVTFGLALLAGCGGGMYSVSGLAGPALRPADAGVQMTLTVPRAGAAAQRRPRTISPATQSLGIAVNGGPARYFDATPTSPGCSAGMAGTTCTFSVNVAPGNDTFVITTYSGPGGSGAALDRATMIQNVTAAGPNVFAIALGPVVSTTADSGQGSLRQAIADANAGDTIAFIVPMPATITLASVMTIGKNVSVAGPGAGSLTISGNNAVEIFVVNAGVTATLSGMTLTQGSAAFGGAIYNNGTLAVNAVTFSANNATAGSGGALYNFNGATLGIANSTFTGNSAPVSWTGGAVSSTSLGTVTGITNSTFTNNSASYGGALAIRSDLSLAGCTFSANTNPGSYGYGAAIWINGNLTVNGGAFTNNFAGNATTASAYGYGGAVYNNSGTTAIANVTFSGNRAGGSGLSSYGYGGAVYAGGTTTFTNSTFTNNQAGGSGYGYGGVFYGSGNVSITGGSIAYNTAQGLGPSGYAYGGAIYAGGAVTASGAIFDHNSATGAGTGYAYGGALYATSVNDTGSTFSNNSATAGAGGSYAYGGAIYYASSSGSTFANTTFSGNAAAGTGGQYAYGGALYASSGSASTAIVNCTFTGNSATTSGALGAGYGGGIYSLGTLNITGSVLSGNSAQTQGGAIAMGGGTLSNVTISGNHVLATILGGDGGGGIYTGGGVFTLTGSTLSGNSVNGATANAGGGGLLVNNAATLKNDTISGNSSAVDGGGIFNRNSTSLINVTVFANSAGGNGGNIATYVSSTTTLANSIIAGGSATSGSDIYNLGGSVVSNDYNLLQSAVVGGSLSGVTTHNITGVSPNLLALANNGGPTRTLADQASSPGKDWIPLAVCTGAGVTADQRGNARGDAGDSMCDVGAYEFP